MQIQVHTDHNIHGYESLAAVARASVEDALRHVSRQITRVEVHVADENGGKHGSDDKRCVMEARLEGHQPMAVTHHAGSVAEAIDGAAEKLEHLIGHTLGRRQSHRAAPILSE